MTINEKPFFISKWFLFLNFLMLVVALYLINYQAYMPMLQRNIDSFIDFSIKKGVSDPEALYGVMVLLLSALESIVILLVIKLIRVKLRR